MTIDEAEWLDLGLAVSIPQRGARQVETSWGAIAVFRTIDDRYFALEDRCPHNQGPLSQGIVHGAAVTCPLHNWVIGLESGQAEGTDHGCARTFPLKIIDGRLYLGFRESGSAAA